MNQPRRYRVPAREVEAINVTTGEANLAAIIEFCPEARLDFYNRIEVPDEEGGVARIGDWIVKDTDGTITVWEHDDFTTHFEETT
jgi:hypothetical protein